MYTFFKMERVHGIYTVWAIAQALNAKTKSGKKGAPRQNAAARLTKAKLRSLKKRRSSLNLTMRFS